MAEQARAAGATIVGEDDLIDRIKEGEIEFDRLLCARQSAQKLNKAGVGRILGPKGLMPNAKQGTMIGDIARAVRGMVGGSEYREKLGVIRLAIGQLAFTPEELQHNIRVLIQNVKKDMGQMSDKISKEIHEVVSFWAPLLTRLRSGRHKHFQLTFLPVASVVMFGHLILMRSSTGSVLHPSPRL